MSEQPEINKELNIGPEQNVTKFYYPDDGTETHYSDSKIMEGLGSMNWGNFKMLEKAADSLTIGDIDEARQKITASLGESREFSNGELLEMLISRYDISSELLNSRLVFNYVTADLLFMEVQNAEDEKQVELAKNALPSTYEALAYSYRFGSHDLTEKLENQLAIIKKIINDSLVPNN